MHWGGPGARWGRQLTRSGKRLLSVRAWKEHDGDHEAYEPDQREGLGQAGDQHEGRPDDGHRDDQPISAKGLEGPGVSTRDAMMTAPATISQSAALSRAATSRHDRIRAAPMRP